MKLPTSIGSSPCETKARVLLLTQLVLCTSRSTNEYVHYTSQHASGYVIVIVRPYASTPVPLGAVRRRASPTYLYHQGSITLEWHCATEHISPSAHTHTEGHPHPCMSLSNQGRPGQPGR